VLLLLADAFLQLLFGYNCRLAGHLDCWSNVHLALYTYQSTAAAAAADVDAAAAAAAVAVAADSLPLLNARIQASERAPTSGRTAYYRRYIASNSALESRQVVDRIATQPERRGNAR